MADQVISCRRQFSEPLARTSGSDFAQRCPRNRPTGYISHTVDLEVVNAEMVRACNVCWSTSVESVRVDASARGIRKDIRRHRFNVEDAKPSGVGN